MCSFRWNLALFHRAGFHTSIVMLLEKQSRRTWIFTQISKTSTLLSSEITKFRGVLVLPKFWQFSSELTKTWSSGATECGVWIGNCNVKVWKSTEHKLHNIWRSVQFQQNEHTPGVCSFCRNLTERQILWSLCSVDFHTLTLQLPIQTSHSVAPELQVFVSSLKFSVKRAHPWFSKVFSRSVLS